MQRGFIRGNWFYCNKCGHKLFRVTPDMVKINVPEYCKICKEEFLITIVNEQVIDDSKHNLGREP